MRSTELPRAGDEVRPLARNLVLLMAFHQTGLILRRRWPQAHRALRNPFLHRTETSSSTSVFSPCAWRPTTSLVRPFYCPMSLCADITKSTLDSDRLPWLPTILKSCLEPPVLAPSCAQDLSAPGCVSAIPSPNLHQFFAPLGNCRFFNELVYFIGTREGWVLRIINILVEEDSPKPQALIQYC